MISWVTGIIHRTVEDGSLAGRGFGIWKASYKASIGTLCGFLLIVWQATRLCIYLWEFIHIIGNIMWLLFAGSWWVHMHTIILSTYRYISALITIDTYELSIVTLDRFVFLLYRSHDFCGRLPLRPFLVTYSGPAVANWNPME